MSSNRTRDFYTLEYVKSLLRPSTLFSLVKDFIYLRTK